MEELFREKIRGKLLKEVVGRSKHFFKWILEEIPRVTVGIRKMSS